MAMIYFCVILNGLRSAVPLPPKKKEKVYVAEKRALFLRECPMFLRKCPMFLGKCPIFWGGCFEKSPCKRIFQNVFLKNREKGCANKTETNPSRAYARAFGQEFIAFYCHICHTECVSSLFSVDNRVLLLLLTDLPVKHSKSLGKSSF